MPSIGPIEIALGALLIAAFLLAILKLVTWLAAEGEAMPELERGYPQSPPQVAQVSVA